MGKKKSKKKVEEEPKRSHQSYEAEIEAKLKIIAKDWFNKSYVVLIYCSVFDLDHCKAI